MPSQSFTSITGNFTAIPYPEDQPNLQGFFTVCSVPSGTPVAVLDAENARYRFAADTYFSAKELKDLCSLAEGIQPLDLDEY